VVDTKKFIIRKSEQVILMSSNGVARQFAADLGDIKKTSLVTTQFTERTKLTTKLSVNKELSSIKELEDLWLITLDEILESGKVTKFNAKIITPDSNEIERKITRFGIFNTISDGKFLRYLPESSKLIEHGRQPASRYLALTKRTETSVNEILPMSIDPTRDSMLALLAQVPDLMEHYQTKVVTLVTS